MKKTQLFLMAAGIAGSLLAGVWTGSRAEDFADKAIAPVKEAITIRQDTQQAEDRWAVEKDKLTARYDALQTRIAEQSALKESHTRDLARHKRSVADVNAKLMESARISEEIAPFLQEIYTRLGAQMAESLPFLSEERKNRMTTLGKIMEDSQVKTSEKFRRLAETLLIEAEYGSTIEVYTEAVLLGDQSIQMRILRLGRLALFGRSLDKKTTVFFNVADKRWEILPQKYNAPINTAMDIAEKQRPAELVNLPMGRMAVQ